MIVLGKYAHPMCTSLSSISLLLLSHRTGVKHLVLLSSRWKWASLSNSLPLFSHMTGAKHLVLLSSRWKWASLSNSLPLLSHRTGAKATCPGFKQMEVGMRSCQHMAQTEEGLGAGAERLTFARYLRKQ